MGGTVYSKSQLIIELIHGLTAHKIYVALFIIAIIALLFLFILSALRSEIIIVSVFIISIIEYIVLVVASVTIEMPGEGFEFILMVPPLFVITILQLVFSIIAIIKIKDGNFSNILFFIPVNNTILAMIMCPLYSDLYIAVAIPLSIALIGYLLINKYFKNDNSTNAIFTLLGVISLLMIAVISMVCTFSALDNKKRIMWEERGYVYVDNEEKEIKFNSIPEKAALDISNIFC